MIRLLLEKFWQWLQMSEEEYNEIGLDQNKCEFEDDFPEFTEMLLCAKKVVNDNILDTASLDCLITVMALDNESGSIVEYIAEHSSNEQIEKIIRIGTSHLQNNARWQLTELLEKTKRLYDVFADFGTRFSSIRTAPSAKSNQLYKTRRALGYLSEKKAVSGKIQQEIE